MFIYTVADLFGIATLVLAILVLLGGVVGSHLKKTRRRYSRR